MLVMPGSWALWVPGFPGMTVGVGSCGRRARPSPHRGYRIKSGNSVVVVAGVAEDGVGGGGDGFRSLGFAWDDNEKCSGKQPWQPRKTLARALALLRSQEMVKTGCFQPVGGCGCRARP